MLLPELTCGYTFWVLTGRLKDKIEANKMLRKIKGITKKYRIRSENNTKSLNVKQCNENKQAATIRMVWTHTQNGRNQEN